MPHRRGGCGPLRRRVGVACFEESKIPLNSAIGLGQTDVPEEFARGLRPPVRESLVVLTHDPALGSAVRAACGPERELFIVGAEADLATHLIGDCAGVVVIDTAATVSPIAQLTQGLKAQFPDLELIVAGGASEAALNAQVTSGAVYRFLHKPASEQRIRLFIDAAWRRRSGEASTDSTSTLAQLSKPAAPRRRLAPGVLVTAALGVVAAAGLVGWLMGQGGTRKISAPAPGEAMPPRSMATREAPPVDAVLDQLLARAGAARARGDWLLPAGESAADLYRQALERHHDDPQALAGLDKVVDQVLSAAEQDLLAQHLEEAEHLTAAARAIAPNSVRVSFLATQIARERDRATRAQARQQLQQQQAAELERKQQLVADARTALTTGKLDEAARLISTAADAGADRDAIDTLTRDLQGARLIAKTNEALAKPSPEPVPPAVPAAKPEATSSSVSAPAAIAPAPVPAPETQPALHEQEATARANEIVNAGTLQRLRYVEPEYPLRARANGTTGWVDLAFDVQTDGTVTDITVLDSSPRNTFENAAVAAVRKWRYRPVVRDGHPVERRAQLRILFTLK